MANPAWVKGMQNPAISPLGVPKPFQNMLTKVLVQSPGRLKSIATKLIDCAEEGQPWAIQMIADRLDGKAIQQVQADLNSQITVVIQRNQIDSADVVTIDQVSDNDQTLQIQHEHDDDMIDEVSSTLAEDASGISSGG